MTAPARRVKVMRKLRMIVSDSRLISVRRRVATRVAGLDDSREREALSWIEAVSIFDTSNAV